MSDFENFLVCLLILFAYVITYMAGKRDVLGQVFRAFEEMVEELNKKDGDNDG